MKSSLKPDILFAIGVDNDIYKSATGEISSDHTQIGTLLIMTLELFPPMFLAGEKTRFSVS